MTSPKEDQQPMTTREELEALASELHLLSLGDWADSLIGIPTVMQKASDALERLASRREVSVEAIAREFRSAMLDTPTDGGFNARATERERIADEYARALLAKYFITKRTTEG